MAQNKKRKVLFPISFTIDLDIIVIFQILFRTYWIVQKFVHICLKKFYKNSFKYIHAYIIGFYHERMLTLLSITCDNFLKL